MARLFRKISNHFKKIRTSFYLSVFYEIPFWGWMMIIVLILLVIWRFKEARPFAYDDYPGMPPGIRR
jgi:hypothetical protein